MRVADVDRVQRELTLLAARRPDDLTLRVEAVERLRRAVPIDGFCFATVDPTTLCMTSSALENVDRRHGPVIYRIEHGAQPDAGRHAQLARARVPVSLLSQATGGVLERSPRYREVLEPLGVRHEVRAAARVGDTTWGFVHLFRGDGRPDFDADEVALIGRCSSLLARALRDAALRGVPSTSPADVAPAVLVLDDHDRLAERTPGAEDHVAALRDPGDPDQPVPEVLITLAVWARVLAAQGRPEAARAQLCGLDGRWRVLHASCTDRGRVAITVQSASADALRPLLLGSYGLTRGERAVVDLALAGRSTKEMAAELVISPHTVQDRLKGVFDKVGVRSRRDLVAALGGAGT